MADILDEIGATITRFLGTSGSPTIISPAPGGGPESDRESNRTRRSGRIGEHITRGHDALGYGGHGDALHIVADQDTEVRAYIDRYIRQSQQKGLKQPKARGNIRLAKPISLEAHIDDFEAISGPYSLFDGTITAPGAGNSQQVITIQLPAGAISPVTLLDRYPGAMYMSVYVRAFSFVPTGTTGTGLQECWFTDIGGSTCGLGIYVASSQTAGDYQNINSLMTSPITDPGNTVLGQLVVNNIGIGGTPTSVRYQLSIGYVAMVPDPWFNEQVLVPPMPMEVGEYLRSGGAQGN